MRINRQFFTVVLILIFHIGFGQNFKNEFQKFVQENDTINQLKILKNWEQSNPKDAELFTSYFNYYFSKSKQEYITLSQEKPNGEGYVLKDSTNQSVGYLGNQIQFNNKEFRKGINKIDTGIELYPNRLDMRFGKIYALGQIEDWKNFTFEIIKTVNYSSKNNNEWTWTDNKKLEDAKNFFLSGIQDYQIQLYNTGSDNLLKNMRDIANEVLKFYPNHIESLSNLSITYLLTKEYDKGLEPLLRAEKLNPKDFIILSNIAQGYRLKGDKQKAIEYYEKTIQYGDEQAKKYARQQITELKNKYGI